MESVMVTGDDGLDLGGAGSSFTFFVPTDAAFEALGTSTVESALTNAVLLKKVTCYAIFICIYQQVTEPCSVDCCKSRRTWPLQLGFVQTGLNLQFEFPVRNPGRATFSGDRFESMN